MAKHKRALPRKLLTIKNVKPAPTLRMAKTALQAAIQQAPVPPLHAATMHTNDFAQLHRHCSSEKVQDRWSAVPPNAQNPGSHSTSPPDEHTILPLFSTLFNNHSSHERWQSQRRKREQDMRMHQQQQRQGDLVSSGQRRGPHAENGD